MAPAYTKFIGEHNGAYKWMTEIFGFPHCFENNEGWRYCVGTYAFYNEKMLALFLLRWPTIVVDKDESIFGKIYPDSTL